MKKVALAVALMAFILFVVNLKTSDHPTSTLSSGFPAASVQSIRTLFQNLSSADHDERGAEEKNPLEVNPEFVQKWNEEVQNVETSTASPDEKTQALSRWAAQLQNAELEFLKSKVLESDSAQEKILGVYLLSLAPNSLSQLQDILNQDLRRPGPHPVHSPEETLAMQEKALRRMALEGLFAKSENDPALRQWAEEKLKELKSRE